MTRASDAQADAAGSRVNWSVVHSRLERVRDTIDRGFEPSAEETRAVLKQRAAALAREADPERDSERQLQIVEFLMAYERYAVEMTFVREVYALKDFTPLPRTPSFVVGIVNVRGRILSIVDLKRLFELPSKGLTDQNKILIVSDGALELGLLVDAVNGVRRLQAQKLQPALPTLTGIREEFLKGVTADRLVVLDVSRILVHPSITVSNALV